MQATVEAIVLHSGRRRAPGRPVAVRALHGPVPSTEADRRVPIGPDVPRRRARGPWSRDDRYAPRYGTAVRCPCRVPSRLVAGRHSRTIATRQTGSHILRYGGNHHGNRARQLLPVGDLVLQSSTSSGRELVVLRFALVLRLAPFGLDESLVFQPIQRRIQRSLLNLQLVLRD